ncbi:MAG: hypothetical protein RBR37_02635 [Advenella sp.]|nr:hypothetical protein [Advenella sp.]
MLQDLDQVAARIGQVVQLSRSLMAERDSISARLLLAEKARDSFRDQFLSREDEFKNIVQRLDNHEQEVGEIRAKAQHENIQLKSELDSAQQDIARLQADLAKAQSELAAFREGALKARDRVEHVLANLPGGIVEGAE